MRVLRLQKGFTLVELAISLALVSTVAFGAFVVTHHTFTINDATKKKITPISQLESAAFWINKDAQDAEYINIDDIGADDFILVTWTEWVLGGTSIQHSVTYYFDDVSNGIGDLVRAHWSSAGANETTTVARYIHHKTGDPVLISRVGYANPILSLHLVCTVDGVMETRDYTVCRRVDFNW